MSQKGDRMTQSNQSRLNQQSIDEPSKEKYMQRIQISQQSNRQNIDGRASGISMRPSQQSKRTIKTQTDKEQKYSNATQELKKIAEGRLDEYAEEEEDIVCLRFPHLQFCPVNYQDQISDCIFEEVLPNIFISGFAAGLATKFLLSKGITHILNVSSTEYTKRTKYFKYLNYVVYNTSNDDIKKHFRITNRFIRDCLDSKGKVLIHSQTGTNIGPCFVLAYMINSKKIPLKQGIEILTTIIPEIQIAQHFQKQLEQYDLEKLALVGMKKSEII